MRAGYEMLAGVLLAGSLLFGCGGGGSSSSGTGGGGGTTTTPTAATPTITTSTSNGAQNGAVIASLATTTSGATIYYTLDGSTPTTSSQVYQAPILVSSNITINAMAAATGYNNSSMATQAFSASIASGTLVWSDEFANSGSTAAQPNSSIWTYDVGTDCCGNNELETYCAWASTTGPCNPSNPNAFLAPGGGLNIVAQQPTPGTATYTSARLKTQGLFSFQYGRIEAKIMLPESQGMWPAFWMLGNNIVTNPWPACGEADIMEHIDGNNTPFGGPPSGGPLPGYDWTQASVHGSGGGGGTPYTTAGFSAAQWHTYGMIWSKGQIQYYIDSPTGPGQPYETFTPSSPGMTPWPFDQGPQFILLNLAVGGDWPGNPNSTTVFPSSMLVDYVRIYAN
jgi:beta-glucanase (GH16 family)